MTQVLDTPRVTPQKAGTQFSNFVRARLAEERRTYQWLGEQIGISRYSVRRRIRGDSPWTLEEVFKIANLFGYTVRFVREN